MYSQYRKRENRYRCVVLEVVALRYRNSCSLAVKNCLLVVGRSRAKKVNKIK